MSQVNILMNTPRVDEDWCRPALERYLHPGVKVLVIPFSFHEDYIPDARRWHECYDPGQKHYEELVQPLERMGVARQDIVFVNYFEDSPRRLGELLNQADVVDLTGGYPDRLIERLWQFGAISQLAAFPRVVMGFSAGAMVQFDRFHVTPEEKGQRYYMCGGLDCIRGFDIEVHYTGSAVQKRCLHRAMRENGTPVLAMEDNGAIILERGKLHQLGKVHFFRSRPAGRRAPNANR